MSKAKYFLIAFLISLPFWWGINVGEDKLEDFFYFQEIANSRFLVAQANIDFLQKELEKVKPYWNRKIEDLKMQADSVISVWWNPHSDEQKILFQKADKKILPIASLTKLVSALVVLEYYDLGEEIKISKEAASQPGNRKGIFKTGEHFQTKKLLYPMLMESNNSATLALTEEIGRDGFVELMNLEVQRLGLGDTHFVNSTGLDPKEIGKPLNRSSAKSLVKLGKYLLKKKPLIFKILSLPEYDLYSAEGVFHHKVFNTNELLEENSRIIGGKTGFTYEAGECFLLILKAPKKESYLINVILGSEDRFEEMKKLIDWTYTAYKW